MSKPTVPDLQELFRQASEIAKQVPERMQEAAFNRALDMLVGPSPAAPPMKVLATKASVAKPTGNRAAHNETPVESLMSSIDSTQHPGVRSATKVLDRALMILQIALNDHGVDGLMPGQIAQLLTEKFRIGTRDSAVRMALGGSSNLVNRVSVGSGYLYKIMEPGLTYLSRGVQGERAVSQSNTPSRTRSTGRKQVPDKPAASKKAASSAFSNAKSADKKSAIRTSLRPKAAILALISSGYFDKPRTGPEVQAQLKVKNGFNMGTDQLRLAMLRLVRTNDLDRDQNAEGQYAYTKRT